jgi:hypothetical protein
MGFAVADVDGMVVDGGVAGGGVDDGVVGAGVLGIVGSVASASALMDRVKATNAAR